MAGMLMLFFVEFIGQTIDLWVKILYYIVYRHNALCEKEGANDEDCHM